MAQHNTLGVYQLPNGNWAYRFTQTVNGKRHNHKSVKDENGEPMKSQKAAIRARQLAIMAAEAKKNQKPQRRVTFAEVYQEYGEKGRSGKAYATIRKQDSLWNNHLAAQFGERFIDGISAAEVNDYLSMLYHTEGRAYRYVEGFLKMFYLIFGQAYSRNYLDVDTYNKLCVNKDARIRMPKMKIDEDTDIVAIKDSSPSSDMKTSFPNLEIMSEIYSLCTLNFVVSGGKLLLASNQFCAIAFPSRGPSLMF